MTYRQLEHNTVLTAQPAHRAVCVKVDSATSNEKEKKVCL